MSILMQESDKSIRSFVRSKNFNLSRKFYTEIGFQKVILEPKLSLFTANGLSFYLQDYYVKDWVENIMLFIEVDNVKKIHQQLSELELGNKYPIARLEAIRNEHWGNAFALIDPCGILWHIGEFK